MTEEFEDRLRRSLRTVAGSTAVPPRPELVLRRAPHAGLRLVAVAAAIVAILGVIAFAQLAGGLHRSLPALHGPGEEQPFPEVSRSFTLDEPEAARAEVARTFGALGLDVTMRLQPVGPSRGPRVLSVEGGIDVDDQDCPPGQPECRIQISAPPGFHGHGVVVVGVHDPAASEAARALALDAFAAGQPLHCHAEVLGAPSVEAEQRLAGLGLGYRLEYDAPGDGPGYVTGAWVTTQGTVVLELGSWFEPAVARLHEIQAGC